jgi:hypothetical protein
MRTFHYSDEDWDAIKKVLDEVGVDDVTICGMPLRAVLEEWRSWYINNQHTRQPTAKQYNAAIEEARDEIAAVRNRFSVPRDKLGYVDAPVRIVDEIFQPIAALGADPDIVEEALRALAALDADLRSRLINEPGRATTSAVKEARNYYWARLMQIWHTGLVPQARRKAERQYLEEFIRYCAGATNATADQVRIFVGKKLKGKKLKRASKKVVV